MGTNAENKVSFGLSNSHYSVIAITDGAITYGTPIKIPGSVSLSIDPRGDMIEFYADNMLYYSAQNNQGYDGKLEIANIPQSFRVNILGEELVSTDNVLLEQQSAQGAAFAFLFEITGDKYASKNLLYNCTATRPSTSANTRTNSADPQTSELDFVSSGRETDGYVKAVTTADTTAAVTAAWYTKVYEKTT